MHNRVRMIVGSFLVKNLLQPWQEGTRWFWDTLVDADLANNTMNWQWVAGSGAGAAPYFRIFNPLTQAKRYDPQSEYVRRWLPRKRNCQLPAPIRADLATSREAALDAYADMRRRAKQSWEAQPCLFATRLSMSSLIARSAAIRSPCSAISLSCRPSACRRLRVSSTCSETVFIVPPRDPRALRRLRIFTPEQGNAVRRPSDDRRGSHAGGHRHRRRAQASSRWARSGPGAHQGRRDATGAPPYLQLTAARVPETRGTAPVARRPRRRC